MLAKRITENVIKELDLLLESKKFGKGYEIKEQPFEDEDEIGIEVNYELVYMNLVLTKDCLTLLELEIMDDEMMNKGITTNIISSLIGICRKQKEINTFIAGGIHNPIIHHILNKFNFSDVGSCDRYIMVK